MEESENDLLTLKRELYASPEPPGREKFTTFLIANFLDRLGCRSNYFSANQIGLEAVVGGGPIVATFHSEISGAISDQAHASVEAREVEGLPHPKSNDIHCVWLIGLAADLARRPLKGGAVRIVFSSDPGALKNYLATNQASHPIVAARADIERSIGMIGSRSGAVGPEAHPFHVRLMSRVEGGAIDSAGRLTVSLFRSSQRILADWSASLRMVGMNSGNGGREARLSFSIDYQDPFTARPDHLSTKISQMIEVLMKGSVSEWVLTAEDALPFVFNDVVLAALVNDVARRVVGSEHVYEPDYNVFNDAFAYLSAKNRIVLRMGIQQGATSKPTVKVAASPNPDLTVIRSGVSFLRSVAEEFDSHNICN